MKEIYFKEIGSFFGSIIGYVVAGVFLLTLGMILWVFPDYSILYYNYASLDSFFFIAPVVFFFLIPAITMGMFAEEHRSGTMELLLTKPLTTAQVVWGKVLASFTLVMLILLPTVVYYYSVYQLGSPKGNLDTGGILGSYIGLIFLAFSFVAIGVFSSAITKSQIVGFLIATLLIITMYWGWGLMAKIPIFSGIWDDFVASFGIDKHYISIRRGVLDTRDIMYFLSVGLGYVMATIFVLNIKRK